MGQMVQSTEGSFETDSSLLEVISGHVLKIDLLCTIDICSVCEDAHGHARSRDIRESKRARE